MPQTTDRDYVAPTLQGHIAYGLEPGVPEPDVSMATTAFTGPVWSEPQAEGPGVRQRAARWLDRHRGAMSKLAEL